MRESLGIWGEADGRGSFSMRADGEESGADKRTWKSASRKRRSPRRGGETYDESKDPNNLLVRPSEPFARDTQHFDGEHR